MRTRTVTTIVAAWLLVAAPAAAGPAVGPRETAETALTQVLSLAQDGAASGASAADRLAEIRRIARETFDFDEIARRSLARHWQARTPEEQAEFVTLFRDLLERSYLTQVEACSGETIKFVGESVEGDLATVRSKVVTGRGTEIPVDYRMLVRDGRWRIYDVVVGGWSFIASYRSQFDRVIRVESYRALHDRLQKKSFDHVVAESRQES